MGKKYSLFGKFDVLCFLETPALKFALFALLPTILQRSRNQNLIKIHDVITLNNILVSVNRKISLATCSYAAKIWIQKNALKVILYNLPWRHRKTVDVCLNVCVVSNLLRFFYICSTFYICCTFKYWVQRGKVNEFIHQRIRGQTYNTADIIKMLKKSV